MYLFICIHFTWGKSTRAKENLFAITHIHVVAVLRGKLALVIFSQEGMGGGRRGGHFYYIAFS